MRKDRGFSLIELLIVVAIILIIAAIAIPSLIGAKIAADDGSAVNTLRTINTAQITYASMFPAVGYASTIAALGPAGRRRLHHAELSQRLSGRLGGFAGHDRGQGQEWLLLRDGRGQGQRSQRWLHRRRCTRELQSHRGARVLLQRRRSTAVYTGPEWGSGDHGYGLRRI